MNQPISHALLWVAVGTVIGWIGAVLAHPAKLSERTRHTHETKSSASDATRNASTNTADPAAPAADEPAARKPTGNFRLELDDPVLRKRLEARDQRLLTWYRETYGPVYDQLFSDFGLDAATRERLTDHMVGIIQAKVEVRKMMTQMVHAQSAYETQLKHLLGDKYPEYREYEDHRRAREEISDITAFAERHGAGALSPDQAKVLQALIFESGAYSHKTLGGLGGPMDAVPPVTSGREKLLPKYEEGMQTLAAQAETVLTHARHAGFSAEQIEVLQNYYAAQIDEYDISIARMRPSPDAIARMEKRIATLRENPDRNRNEIRRFEFQLRLMRAREAEGKR